MVGLFCCKKTRRPTGKKQILPKKCTKLKRTEIYTPRYMRKPFRMSVRATFASRARACVRMCVEVFFLFNSPLILFLLKFERVFFSFSIIFIGAILHLPVWNMVCFSLCSILLFHTIVYKNAIHRYIQSHTHSFLLALFRCTATIQSGCVSDIWNNIYNILKVVCVEPIPITVLKWIEFCLHIVIVACTHTHTYTFNQLFVLYFVCRIVRLHVVLSNYLFDK